MKLFKILFLLLLLNLPIPVYASSMPRPIGNEERIKIINYTPNTVFKFIGHYYYQSIIEFGLDETIETISMGSPSAWQLVPAGNRIFLKPVGDDATTNMTVITNKRMYFFEMHAQDAEDITDSNLSFIVKFVYPEDNNYNALAVISNDDVSPNLTVNPEKYNFHYTISGDAFDIEPLQVFDDGEFTYFKFKDINAELPAIFLVNEDRTEALINYRIAGGYLVVERVAPRYTLRRGKGVVCVYNENMIAERKELSREKHKKGSNLGLGSDCRLEFNWGGCSTNNSCRDRSAGKVPW